MDAKHQVERCSKGFTCWTQLVSMMFCHMAHADSFHEICGGLSCSIGKLRHQGITRSPRKSTLSYANQSRPAELYEELYWIMLNLFREIGEQGNSNQKFRLKNKLFRIDSITISLRLSLFLWGNSDDQRRNQGSCLAAP
jgi:hypothetical protein